jgi:flavin reductase (DIM6/NTAB) family NADH-FMN oxidoreductase RutF
LIIDPKTFERFNAVLTGVIVPRPIAFVSTVSHSGEVNLAPYSFFNAVSYRNVVFSSSRNVGNKSKDTLRNIEETGEFVVNIVVDPIAEAMNATAAEFPEGEDEFGIAGLTHAPSQIVKAPRVAESPVNIECKLDQIVQLGSGDHEHGLVIGEILLMHVRDDIIDGHRIDQAKLMATGRMAGNMYCRTGERYEMVRPVYDPTTGAAVQS